MNDKQQSATTSEKSEKVKQLLIDKSNIEIEIRKLDKMALINYELELL